MASGTSGDAGALAIVKLQLSGARITDALRSSPSMTVGCAHLVLNVVEVSSLLDKVRASALGRNQSSP